MVGGCLQITYTGASASCLLVGDAAAHTLTAKIGAAGAEAPDAAFGVAGVLDLTGATVDTLAELAAVITAYADYTAVVYYGDDIPTTNIVSTTVQAKTVPGYVLFTLASVLSSYALTTWARAKLFLGLSDSDQTMAEYLLNAATEAGEQIAARRLKARAYTKDLDGSGRSKLLLPDFPINSITSINIDSTRIFAAGTVVDPADYIFYADEGTVCMPYSSFSAGFQNVRVVYNGGFSTVPDYVQAAAIEVLSWNLKRLRGSGIGIRSITSPDGVNTSMELEMPMSARKIFESLRDVRL